MKWATIKWDKWGKVEMVWRGGGRGVVVPVETKMQTNSQRRFTSNEKFPSSPKFCPTWGVCGPKGL